MKTIVHMPKVKRVLKHSFSDFTTWEEGQYRILIDDRLVKIFSYQTDYALIDGYKTEDEAKHAAEEYEHL